MKLFIPILFLFASFWSIQASAQSNAELDTIQVDVSFIDTLSLVRYQDSVTTEARRTVKIFRPDPIKATWLAVLVPGLGQIYNRKYWKLPILYGGMMGLGYSISANNANYVDYKKAYSDLIDNNPSTDSYKYYNLSGNSETILKNNMDMYRRYRDISIIGVVLLYAISVVDAFVDAQLFDFDISPDLSSEKTIMRLEPVIMTQSTHNTNAVGVHCSIKF